MFLNALRWASRQGTGPLSVALAGLLWVAVHFLASPTLTRFEERSGDLIWRLTAEQRDERRLIVVDIDERSLREVGPWPWSRATQARLISQIAALGAQQQVIDIVFADHRDDDPILLAAVSQHRPVLAQVFALEQGGAAVSGQLAGALDWPACPAPFGQATGYLGNVGTLIGNRQTGSVGHITPRIAADGVVRHQPAVICYRDQAFPSLALAALMQGSGETSLALGRGTGWFDPPWKLTSPGFGSGFVPMDERGDVRVSWRAHPSSFISVSAADVLAGKLPANLLERAWVLVGSSAFGLNDTIATPFAGAASGLQAHAQIITALIDGRTPYSPRAEWLLKCAGGVFGVLLLAGLMPRLSVAHGRLVFPTYLLPVAALIWVLLLWLGHAIALSRSAQWIGWVDPAIFVLAAGSIMGILEHARSRIDRDRLYAHLSSYLPAPVAAALALQPPSSAIKASTNHVAVLFADIRNFSAYCEARPPDEAAAVLHAFFSTASRVVEAHNGVIEAFQGDAILAVWNGEPVSAGNHDPARLRDHAARALQAAVSLLAEMQGVLPDPAPAGLEPLSLGIGVETGPAMAGSFGLASRRTHMVMGRTVTIATHLTEMTAELAHPILVGEGLASQIGGTGLESMGIFLLDGMKVPHHIYAYPLQSAPPIHYSE